MPYSKTVMTLYLDQLKTAQKELEAVEGDHWQDTSRIKYFAHKILGTASLFGDQALSDSCQDIDDQAHLFPEKNDRDLQFVKRFGEELLLSIEKFTSGEVV